MADLHPAIGLALEHELATLTVNPWLVRPAARLLARSPVRVATVIGYAHGGQVAAVKAFEASQALEDGATQLDFVLNAGALVSGDDEAVLNDMLAVIEMAHSAMAVSGVIVQAAPVGDERIRRACRLASRAAADYIVTTSGEEPAAAAIQLARLLHQVVGEELEITAAGVFTDLAQVVEAVAAGAAGISTSFSARLANETTAWLRESTAAAEPLADVAATAR